MAPVPEFRQLRSFVAVAEAGSFSQAAAREHLSQQALSQQVRAMENLLGVQLLERSSRGVEPTPAGETLLREARRVIAAAERAVAQTVAVAAGRSSLLRLGHTLASAADTVPRLLGGLADASPRLHVIAIEFTARDLERALRDGEVELALAPASTAVAEFASRVVAEVPLVLAIAAADPLAQAAGVPLPELAARTIHVWPREVAPGYHDAVVSACRAAGFEPRLDTSAAGSSVWSRIAGGPGIGLITAGQAAALPPSIRTVDLAAPAPTLAIELRWRADDPPLALPQALAALGVAGAESDTASSG